MKKNLLGLLILVAGIAVATVLLKTAPVAGTKEKKSAPKSVQTIQVTPANHSVTLSAYGTVVPSRELTVSPEVTARILSQHPALAPGGRIPAREPLVQLDRSEFEIALRNARAALTEAEAAISIEKGRQIVAQREYQQLLKDLPSAELNRELVLRTPFKQQADAAVARAQAAIARAELDLSRTEIRSPFDALVISESVEPGQLADAGQPLATLVGSKSFWVRVSIPFSDLSSIKLPTGKTAGANAQVRLTSSNQAEPASRSGQVIRLLGDLGETGRLARVVVEVKDPLDPAQGPPLLLGSYVQVDIEAGTIPNALEIPRSALREGNQLWAVGEDNLLVIHEVNILWRNQKTLFISNVLAPGEDIIVSDLSAALPGMLLAPQPAP